MNIIIFLVIVDNHQPVPSGSSTASSSSTSTSYSEDSIKHITKSGFSREQAIEELRLTNGDPTKALISLMAKSLAMPKRKR